MMDEIESIFHLFNEGVIEEEEMDDALERYSELYVHRRSPQSRRERYGPFNLDTLSDEEKITMPTSEDTNNENDTENARELFQIIKEISDLLGTGLDAEALRYCIRLCENGVNPETLAAIVLELQSEVQHYNARKRFSSNGTGDKEKI